MDTTLAFLVFMVTVEGTSAQVHLSSPMAGGRVCYKDQFEVTCWYPEVTAPGRYLVPSPGWKANGSALTLDGTTYQEQRINSTATKLIVTVTDTFSVNTDVNYSCFLVLADTRLDENSQQVHVHIMATPKPPVITNVTSLNTSISLNWTHDKTCFESVPLEYHIVVNTDTQPIITGEIGTVITVVSGTPYTVSVMAAVDDSLRSEPDRENVTAGYPATRASTPHQCFDRHFNLTCHHEYETTDHVWCMDGIPVEHDGKEFAISHRDGMLTLMDVSQSKYAERDTIFQCCVNLTSGPQVCGEHYIFDPLEQPKAPVVTGTTEEQTSISLSWEVSEMCFESVDFTVNIFWSSASGQGQVMNVSGSSYDITGLTPGVSYDITLVATGDGVRSDNISISATTLSRDGDTLAVGTVIAIAVGASVVVVVLLAVVAVLAVTGFARWWKGKHSGTYLARDPPESVDEERSDTQTKERMRESHPVAESTKQGQRTAQGLTYVTVYHSQPRPINAPNENLDVQYTGVKFDTEAPAVITV